MSFSMGPFGTTRAGLGPVELAGENASTLSSSRKIDALTKRYVQNAEGGFEAMDDVAQCVLLLVAFADRASGVITPATIARAKDRITKALAVMTKGPEPQIKLLRVDILNDATGHLSPRITYRNLLTNTLKTVGP